MEKKNKGGRPTKYTEVNLKQIQKLSGYGLTDLEISNVIGVAYSTLSLWKEKYEDFSEALKNGKAIADAKVLKSLYKRALGYKHKDIIHAADKGVIITKDIMKHYPPDTTACIFWMKNRQPERWRANPDELQGQQKLIIEVHRRDEGIKDTGSPS